MQMTIEFTSQHTLGPHAMNQRDGAVLIDGSPIEAPRFPPWRDGAGEGWREWGWLPSSLAPTLDFVGVYWHHLG